jgi:nitrogenase molybdenum-cofactor synthesis protein NifE
LAFLLHYLSEGFEFLNRKEQPMSAIPILKEREDQIWQKGDTPFNLTCDKHSLAGSISQRACVFCGSRVVLYPIANAVHLVHGPIGCAAYTWDIRGALSSGPELHRLSFSTDLREKDVIFGGEKKLYNVLNELIDRYQPKAAFVYSTCIVGIIGDDVQAVCRRLAKEKNIPVLPVNSEGFKGTKKDGYKAACEALFQLIGTGNTDSVSKYSINILGEFNIGGEAWIIKEYYKRMGVEVVSVMTGDGRVEDVQRSHGAALNVVQCSGSMTYLANMMKEKYGIPFIRVSYFGIEDMSKALYDVAEYFKDNPEIMKRTQELVREEISTIYPQLQEYKRSLIGKKAAIYVGGAFKAFSLIRALRHVGMGVMLAGSQTGNPEDYEQLRDLCDDGTIILDDANPLELSKYIIENGADLVIGGVKERPIAYKMGIGFCDHNHERKIPLAGYVGMLNFAKEVYESVTSPVWKFAGRGDNESSAPIIVKKKVEKIDPASKNACKLCTPLGASLAFKGIKGAIPLLHGSQGCSTYIRRYLISHYKEPVDIACSNFGEQTAIFGGGMNLQVALENIEKQYRPELIGIATTCLSETIGDDVPMFIRNYRETNKSESVTPIVHVSTPSYKGTHIDGFHGAVKSLVSLAEKSDEKGSHVNLFPGMLSPADLRHLKEIVSDFGLPFVMVPDYSKTLDGSTWKEYHKIPDGGTPVQAIRETGSAKASFEFGRILSEDNSAGKLLKEQFDIPLYSSGLPIGINETDIFFKALEEISGSRIPEKYKEERGRLIDAYIDGHKYVSGKTAVIYGEEDLVVGLASFLNEIGVIPVLCASGGQSGHLKDKLTEVLVDTKGKEIQVIDGVDFVEIEEQARILKPDFLIGHSKGYSVARKINVPLVRIGFPIHDRVGGARVLHVGYRGAFELFDKIVNTLLEHRQEESDIGYSYM